MNTPQAPKRAAGMETNLLESRLSVQNLGPEVKSFIYQAILEFEHFCGPGTVVNVTTKDPLELLSQNDEDSEHLTRAFDIAELPSKKKLKGMYRIAISLVEGDSKIESEGLHENIYEAVRMAKDHLLQTLTRIQDDVISSQDRTMQIRQAMATGTGVH